MAKAEPKGKSSAPKVAKAFPSFTASAATMAQGRARLSAIVDRAAAGGEVGLKRWKEELYRIGPPTILTAAERERGVQMTVNELRENFANSCSRMSQTLRPVLIMREGKPVAALWRSKTAAASESELAAASVFRTQVDRALAKNNQIVVHEVVQAMAKMLKATLPEAIRDAAGQAVTKALEAKLDGVSEDVATEIVESVVEQMATSDRFAELIRVLAARLEHDE